MSNARRAVPNLKFNGKNVDTALGEFLESVSYEDVASGNSDSISIQLNNLDTRWLSTWYPAKGDKISASIAFQNWLYEGDNRSLSCGNFTLDEIKFSGGPLVARFGGLSIPAGGSFKTQERTKTWKKVTIKQIASSVAKRYGLKLSYSGPSIKVDSLEQSQKSDSSFLYELCKNYGLSMKVYKSKIVIYDQTAAEKKGAVATLNRASFEDDQWEFTDSIFGTYTGAKISYKPAKAKKATKLYLGIKKENAKGARTLNINQTVSNQKDAYYKAAAKVNQSNEQATTISGTIMPNPAICAGVCIQISGMGKANGKYFVDKSTTEVGSDGTSQRIEAHKCQKRLTYSPKK